MTRLGLVGRPLFRAARAVDLFLARNCFRLFGDRPGLISLVFHSVVDDGDLERGLIDPRYCMTVAQVEQCIEYFVKSEYTPVRPRDVIAGLTPGRRYVMFVFDDGYFNNTRVLPILERHRAPATFAVPTDYVLQGRAFWWDVLYRCQRRAGATDAAAWAKIDGLLQEDRAVIEGHIRERFGDAVLEPVGDLDRPFTPDELRSFARHDLVVLANHTHTHAYLPARPDRAEADIKAGQEALERMTGIRPEAIAYPFGGCSPEVARAAQRAGLRLGFCVGSQKRRLPIDPNRLDCMTLPRWPMSPSEPIERQCVALRLDWRLLRGLWALWRPETQPPLQSI